MTGDLHGVTEGGCSVGNGAGVSCECEDRWDMAPAQEGGDSEREVNTCGNSRCDVRVSDVGITVCTPCAAVVDDKVEATAA